MYDLFIELLKVVMMLLKIEYNHHIERIDSLVPNHLFLLKTDNIMIIAMKGKHIHLIRIKREQVGEINVLMVVHMSNTTTVIMGA